MIDQDDNVYAYDMTLEQIMECLDRGDLVNLANKSQALGLLHYMLDNDIDPMEYREEGLAIWKA